MSNVYTLDSLRADLDNEFAPLKLEVDGQELVLQNVLRLPKKKREKVFELLKSVEQLKSVGEDGEAEGLGMEEADTFADLATQIVTLVGDNAVLARKLATAMGEEIALALKIFELWMDATQSGEAERSDS